MKPTKFHFALLACVFLIFTSVANSQNASKIKVTGLFSSLYQNTETDDIAGMELLIVEAQSKYYAMLQLAEGEPYKPIIVEVKIIGDNIEFKTPGPPQDSTPQDVFKGKISQNGIKGRWQKAGYEEFLKRGKSFWQ